MAALEMWKNVFWVLFWVKNVLMYEWLFTYINGGVITRIILFKLLFFLFSFNCIIAGIAIVVSFRKLIELEASMPYALFWAMFNAKV